MEKKLDVHARKSLDPASQSSRHIEKYRHEENFKSDISDKEIKDVVQGVLQPINDKDISNLTVKDLE
jgi:hypothetical protein